jgi:hypothetical protein
MYSVASCVAQNRSSAATDLNLGIFLSFFIVHRPLLPDHAASAIQILFW